MIESAGAFAGRHVFMTGATGGIGSVVAGKLAREGCRISAVGRNKQRLADLEEFIENLGGKCRTIHVDLAETDVAEGAVDAAEASFGPIDSAFLLAGSFPLSRIEAISEERIASAISLNLVSPIQLIRVLASRMATNSGGKICVTSSVAGLLPMPYLSVYSAAKSGLAMFCRSARPELRDIGVSLTCVAPRAVDTRFISALRPIYDRLGWAIDSPETVAEIILRSTALGKNLVIIGGIERFGAALSWISPDITERILESMRRIIGNFLDGKSDEPD